MMQSSIPIPSCRRHKPSGHAVVSIHGKDHYLGKWDTPESRERYNRLLAEWRLQMLGLPNSDREARQ